MTKVLNNEEMNNITGGNLVAAFEAGVAVGTAIYNEFDTEIADAIDAVVGFFSSED